MSFARAILRKIFSEADNVSAAVRFPFIGEPLVHAMERRPAQLYIETTNICNANCVFCWYQYQERPHGVMEQAVYEKALTEFAALGGGALDLTPAAGDPLIDGRIIERIRLARSIPEITEIRMFSNMILADRRGIPELVASGLSRLTISAPGFDAATYQRVYRSPRYRKMLENVLAFLTENRRAGLPITVTLGIRSDRSLRDLAQDPDMVRVVERLGWENVEAIHYYKNWGGSIGAADLTAGMRLKPPVRWRHPRIGPCIQPYVGMIVYHDGTVGACSCAAANGAELIIGDVKRQSLLEIWRGESLRRLRRSFSDGTLPPVCKACNDYSNLSQILRENHRATREALARSVPAPERDGESGQSAS